MPLVWPASSSISLAVLVCFLRILLHEKSWKAPSSLFCNQQARQPLTNLNCGIGHELVLPVHTGYMHLWPGKSNLSPLCIAFFLISKCLYNSAMGWYSSPSALLDSVQTQAMDPGHLEGWYSSVIVFSDRMERSYGNIYLNPQMSHSSLEAGRIT